MREIKQSKLRTLQLIVDILSFETSGEVLKKQMTTHTIDWDQVVTIASEHLVLPAVYCRLQQKSLLEYLPADLNHYLEELTQLNRERNETLLNEVEQISMLFKNHLIEYVLIKGTALLVGNYYKDIGERMIGDIDILVASKDLDKAFNLLVNEGYNQFVDFNYEVQNYRHRPRQIAKNRLGAVELHDQLLKHNYNHLIDKDLFLSGKEIHDGIAIPNPEMLIWNIILAHQINDRCYYYNTLRLKSLYDVLVLGLSDKEQLIKDLSYQKYSSSFLNLASAFCTYLDSSNKNLKNKFKKYAYLSSLKFPKLEIKIIYLKSLYIGLVLRLNLLVSNKSYRTHLLKNKLNQ